MRIFNIMLSRDLGGIQQVYVDYHQALAAQNHQVFSIASSNAAINQTLQPNLLLPNLGSWCILSRLKLWYYTIKYQPDVIICHGARAIQMTSLCTKTIKIIGVAHSYRIKALAKCQHIIALTNHLQKFLIEHQFAAERISLVPNMIHLPIKMFNFQSYRTPIVIGALGRFVEAKGFEYLLKAINILIHQRQLAVKLLIGGDGPLAKHLKQLAKQLQLDQSVEFIGWVEDKEAFFRQIDIYCLSSILESFGIVILEAIVYHKPVVATDVSGPASIIEHQVDGLLAQANSAIDLANQLEIMCKNQSLAETLSKNAHQKVANNFQADIVATTLSRLLTNITTK